jgi:hypothetical protein
MSLKPKKGGRKMGLVVLMFFFAGMLLGLSAGLSADPAVAPAKLVGLALIGLAALVVGIVSYKALER